MFQLMHSSTFFRYFMQAPEYDMKHLKKVEECIGQNAVNITIKMKIIVLYFDLRPGQKCHSK